MKNSLSFASLLTCLAAIGLAAGCEVETFDDAVARTPNSPAPPSPPPPPPPPPPPVGFGPDFSAIQANVFTPDCATAGCHSGANPPAGLNLEAANSYAMLVGIQSSQDGTLQRVEPGSPANSYLIRKLEGTASVGQTMPPTTPLPQSEIDVIRQWISDGATDDRVVPGDPITVTSISPMPDAALAAAPGSIVAGFSRELNQTTVDATTFLLTGSGGDGDFTDNDEVTIAAASISVGANSQSAVFELTGVQLNDDTYRIGLLGNATSAILDLDGNRLDGEYSGNLPSGNGIEGGDFFVQFTLATQVVINPTLNDIQAAVFTPTCATSTCHAQPNPSAGLDLSDADTSHAALFNQPSSQDMGLMLVAPGLPDDSYLVHKIEGTQSQGQRMPAGGALPLSQAEIAAIRQWIVDGAAR
jgi:hypothetical protein